MNTILKLSIWRSRPLSSLLLVMQHPYININYIYNGRIFDILKLLIVYTVLPSYTIAVQI